MRSLCLLALALLLGACVVQLDDVEGRACDPDHPCVEGRVCERRRCVVAPAVASLSVVPAAARLYPGEELQLAAFARGGDGRQLLHRLVWFESTTPDVATVTPGGRVRALAAGEAELVAHADQRTFTVPVRVDPPDLDATVFVATGGSDEGACTEGEPCATLDRAFRASAPGAVIELAAGSYPAQTIYERSGNGGVPVLVRPAAGATVTIDVLDSDGSNLIFRDLQLGRVIVAGDSHDLTFLNVSIVPGGVDAQASTRLSILGSELGPGAVNEYGVQIAEVHELNFSMNRIRSYGRAVGDCCGPCFLAHGGEGLALLSNRFEECGDYGIQLSHWTVPEAPRNVLIENNFIHVRPDGVEASVVIDNAACDNVLVRNNSTTGVIAVDEDSTLTGLEILGNIAIVPQACFAGAIYRANLWEGGTCDAASDLDAIAHFQDLSVYDLHLVSTSPGIDAMSAGDAPLEDIDGEPRKTGGKVEIGADEQG